MLNHLKRNLLIIIYASTWFCVNLLTLITYPLMHSDESWLAGLSATMLAQKDLMATEPFFDLAPRAPHTLKTLFHLIQMPFIHLLGYNLFSVRLVSLVVAFLCLLLLYHYFNHYFTNKWFTLLSLILITLNSQFLYSAHFARQEILLVFVFLVCMNLYIKTPSPTPKTTLLISTIIGFSISLHPNAFIIAFMIGMLFLHSYITKNSPFKTLIFYICPMAIMALINLAITFTYTPNFINAYWQYASTLSVGASPSTRTTNFIEFYVKLYNQISGTYFLTNLKPLITFTLITIVLAIGHKLIVSKFIKPNTKVKITQKNTPPVWQCLSMMIGYNMAIFIIGRNNPTSIIFLVIVILIMVPHLIHSLRPAKLQLLLLAFCLTLTLIATYKDMDLYKNHDYTTYAQFITDHTSASDITLGNLTSGFSHDPNQFYDIRNLSYLGDLSLIDYISSRSINTIIYYEEYDYIHRNPQWQILYGDDANYYEAMQKLIEEYGSLRAETQSPYYGNRIIRYMGDYDWSIQIYDIDLPTNN